MHLIARDDSSTPARNSEAPVSEFGRTAPTPPEGGWSAWYLTDEEDMGESTEQGIIIRLLLAALAELGRERGWARSLVAGDQFFAWVEEHPLVRISPDVYILDDPPTPPYPASFQTWRSGHAPPRFAVEVVSEKWQKDYREGPRKYDQLGTRELVVFDPAAVGTTHDRRVALQVFRREADGRWVQVAAGPGPVYSAEIDAWLVVVGARLRVARDAAGTLLVRTAEEKVLELERDLGELRGEHAELQGKYAELQGKYAELQGKYAELQGKYDELQGKYDELQGKYVDVQGVVAELLRRVEALDLRTPR